MGLIQVASPVLGPSVFRRNLIINGGFDIWQRALGSSSWVAPFSNFFPLDRWKAYVGGTGGVGSCSRESFTLGQTDVPGEPTYYIEFDITSAPSGQTAGVGNSFQQYIEDVRTGAGRTVTLSFWSKGSGTLPSILLSQYFAGGSSTVYIPVTTDFVLSAGWTYHSFTVDLPSIAGKTISGDNHCITVNFCFPVNTTYNLCLSQVQLEIGSVPTPFEYRTFAEELAMCMRYYEKSFPYGVMPAQNTGESLGVFTIPIWTATANQNMGTAYYKAVKRATNPTITTYNPFAAGSGWSRSGSGDYAAAVNAYGEHSFGLRCGGTPVVGGALQIHWTASAEL